MSFAMFARLAISNNLKHSQTISNNLKQSQTISNSPKQSQTVSNNLKQSQTISNNLKQSQTISNNLKQSQTVSNSFKQSQTISNNLKQSQTISNSCSPLARWRSLDLIRVAFSSSSSSSGNCELQISMGTAGHQQDAKCQTEGLKRYQIECQIECQSILYARKNVR